MYKPPVSLTICGWLLSVVGLLTTYFGSRSMSLSDDPTLLKAAENHLLPLSVQLGLDVVLGIILFISGVNILRGENWARWFYAICAILFFIVGFVNAPEDLILIPLAIFHGTIIVFLFLPKATEYLSVQ
jgi:chromate transport protein ChrA